MEQQTNTVFERLTKNKWLAGFMILVIFGLILAGAVYFSIAARRIAIDDASVIAPTVALSPSVPGILQEVYVNEGDRVLANTVVARVGNELVKSLSGGIITSVSNNIGATTNPAVPVVTMIDPSELRVVGQIAEDKGLADVSVGQSATFTVDTFGKKEYVGVVDEISPVPHQNSLSFSISNTRAVKDFDIKVRFDVSKYPELKNGMSAKITIYK